MTETPHIEDEQRRAAELLRSLDGVPFLSPHDRRHDDGEEEHTASGRFAAWRCL